MKTQKIDLVIVPLASDVAAADGLLRDQILSFSDAVEFAQDEIVQDNQAKDLLTGADENFFVGSNDNPVNQGENQGTAPEDFNAFVFSELRNDLDQAVSVPDPEALAIGLPASIIPIETAPSDALGVQSANNPPIVGTVSEGFANFLSVPSFLGPF